MTAVKNYNQSIYAAATLLFNAPDGEALRKLVGDRWYNGLIPASDGVLPGSPALSVSVSVAESQLFMTNGNPNKIGKIVNARLNIRVLTDRFRSAEQLSELVDALETCLDRKSVRLSQLTNDNMWSEAERFSTVFTFVRVTSSYDPTELLVSGTVPFRVTYTQQS